MVVTHQRPIMISTENTPSDPALSKDELVSLLQAELTRLGWTAQNELTAIASKTWETDDGPKTGHAYLADWGSGNYLIEGFHLSGDRNVLSACSQQARLIPWQFRAAMNLDAVRAAAAQFALDVEGRIAASYAVHQLSATKAADHSEQVASNV